MYENLISRMTLEEKCAFLSGKNEWESRDFAHLGIPSCWFSDGPHGLRKQAGAGDHLGINGSEPATCFPTAATVASTWNPQLVEELGLALGEEAHALHVNVLLGPGLCIKRSPLCGRDFEYFSEDPFLAGKVAAAYVRGVQEAGVAACPKHFAANSQETRRMSSDSVMDERTMREIYLAAFEHVVREGHPRSIMSSYNLVNGTYANENREMLTQILRDEWGFDGAVVTDWGGSNNHVAGVAAGSNIEMPAPGLGSARELLAAVHDGSLSEDTIDRRVDELLGLVMGGASSEGPAPVDVAAHDALAHDVAAQGIVLLKNDPRSGVEAGEGKGASPILPLAPDTKVALIGDFAETPRYQGAGSSLVNPFRLDTLLELSSGEGIACVGYEPGYERHGGKNDLKRAAALELARQADVVLLCLGLDEVKESEGSDRANMDMATNQLELLDAVHRVNPHVVVLLSCGSPVETSWAEKCEALVWCGLFGQAGARAVLDVVLGRENPSGRLAETWPVKLADSPTCDIFPSSARTAEYREGIYVGYRYYATADVPVAFPFGFGLSYTTFSYELASADADGVTFSVTNTGPVAGAEVCQLYVSRLEGDVFRPVRELKGFSKVFLEPGKTSTVTIPLDERSFGYWNVTTHQWEVEGGSYELRIGSSSQDVRLTAEVSVEGTGAANPYEGLDLPSYRTGAVRTVADPEFAALLGRDIPSSKVRIDRNMCMRDLIHGRSPIFWLVWCVLTVLLKITEKRGKPSLNLLFQYNMPLRALAKMTGGAFSMGMVDGLVMEIQGFWIIGIVRFLVEFVINLVSNAGLAAKLSASEKGDRS